MSGWDFLHFGANVTRTTGGFISPLNSRHILIRQEEQPQGFIKSGIRIAGKYVPLLNTGGSFLPITIPFFPIGQNGVPQGIALIGLVHELSDGGTGGYALLIKQVGTAIIGQIAFVRFLENATYEITANGPSQAVNDPPVIVEKSPPPIKKPRRKIEHVFLTYISGLDGTIDTVGPFAVTGNAFGTTNETFLPKGYSYRLLNGNLYYNPFKWRISSIVIEIV